MNSYAFVVELASRPLEDPSVMGEEMYPARVFLGRAIVFSTVVSNQGGPLAADEMRDEVMRQFAKRLAQVMSPGG